MSASTVVQALRKGQRERKHRERRNPISGSVTHEETLVWNHLTAAGYLSGSYTFTDTAASDATTPRNQYGSYLDLVKRPAVRTRNGADKTQSENRRANSGGNHLRA
jgi:hypothetical protein